MKRSFAVIASCIFAAALWVNLPPAYVDPESRSFINAIDSAEIWQPIPVRQLSVTESRSETGMSSTTGSPGRGSNLARSGSVRSWGGPELITAEDSTTSTISFSGAGFSDYLLGDEFDLGIPSENEIDGIKVSWKRTDSHFGTIVDDSIVVLKSGVPVGADRSAGAEWPGELDFADFGGESDLWDEEWTPADFNDGGSFGVGLSCSTPGFDATAVDFVVITVYHHVPDAADVIECDAELLQEPDVESADATVAIVASAAVSPPGDIVTASATVAIVATADIFHSDDFVFDPTLRHTVNQDDDIAFGAGTTAIIADLASTSNDNLTSAATAGMIHYGNAVNATNGIEGAAGIVVAANGSGIQSRDIASGTSAWDVAVIGAIFATGDRASGSATVATSYDGASAQRSDRTSSAAKIVVAAAGVAVHADDRTSATSRARVTAGQVSRSESDVASGAMGTTFIAHASRQQSDLSFGAGTSGIALNGAMAEAIDHTSGAGTVAIVAVSTSMHLGDRASGYAGPVVTLDAAQLAAGDISLAAATTSRPLNASLRNQSDIEIAVAAVSIMVGGASREFGNVVAGASTIATTAVASVSQAGQLVTGASRTSTAVSQSSTHAGDLAMGVMDATARITGTGIGESNRSNSAASIAIIAIGDCIQSNRASGTLISAPNTTSIFKSKIFKSAVLRSV